MSINVLKRSDRPFVTNTLKVLGFFRIGRGSAWVAVVGSRVIWCMARIIHLLSIVAIFHTQNIDIYGVIIVIHELFSLIDDVLSRYNRSSVSSQTGVAPSTDGDIQLAHSGAPTAHRSDDDIASRHERIDILMSINVLKRSIAPLFHYVR
jgi:hypothetical protein